MARQLESPRWVEDAERLDLAINLPADVLASALIGTALAQLTTQQLTTHIPARAGEKGGVL